MPIVDVDQYLERIRWSSPVAVDAHTLAGLQTAHMIAVPFENLHVHARLPVRATTDWSLPKVVGACRGGWCFEMNGAFGALLEALGFQVTYHSARVFDGRAGRLGPPLDHLCLIVEADGARWLVDVGFGDSTLRPLPVDDASEQDRLPRPARIDHVDGELQFWEEYPDEGWSLRYVVDPAARTLPEFQPRSDELWSGADGGFWTEKPFATRALDDRGGRVWLLRDRLKLRHADRLTVTEEHEVAPAEWDAELERWFSMAPPTA